MTSNLIGLLGGAERGRTRVRGFAPWNPEPESLALLAQVNNVLAEYSAYLPLTLRQIFYRLVGAHNFEKTEQAYGRLGECLNRARRSRRIPMDVMRDDGGVKEVPRFWESGEDFLDGVRYTAKNLRLDRTEGQPIRLVVMPEAGGMVPQLARIANPYGIAVISPGGFDSTTDKHNFAASLVDHGRPTEVLDIGDHDASGVHKVISLNEDVQAFIRDLGGEVTITRLAVTPTQIRDLGLPTAPPKPTDKRAFNGETCQAEAIAPDTLAEILRDAIEERLDRNAYERVLKREKTERRNLMKILGAR